MKKNSLLLCSVLLCCISGFSKTLSGLPTTISGQAHAFTVSGENLSKYGNYVNYLRTLKKLAIYNQAFGTGSTAPTRTDASACANQQAQNDLSTNEHANTNLTCTTCYPYITSSTMDGTSFTNGTAISIGYHTLVVNASESPQITFASYFGNNIQISQQSYGGGSGDCYFYYSGGSAAIQVTLVNQCSNRSEQLSFSQK